MVFNKIFIDLPISSPMPGRQKSRTEEYTSWYNTKSEYSNRSYYSILGTTEEEKKERITEK